MKNRTIGFATILLILLSLSTLMQAQTTAFTYQGSLKDGASSANGNYDFEFKLFDLVSAGAQQGSTLQRLNVAVANGVFTVSLDFGAGTLPGADRFLDIAVRTAGGGAFTALTPRQKVNSAPYSVKSLNSATADTATNATQLGGVAASQYVVTTDPRMTDARQPTAGSTEYIQNSTLGQASSNFNISGTGTANILNAATQFNISSNRILSVAGTDNLFAGVGAGQTNLFGNNNSFFGKNAGRSNTNGSYNAFFGKEAGDANTTGVGNAFFGSNSGFRNTSGGLNSFFGPDAGLNNSNGTSNAFFGASTGSNNNAGSNNTLLGSGANVTVDGLTFATAIGSGATVGTSNTVVLGRPADNVQIPGTLVVTGAISGTAANSAQLGGVAANQYLTITGGNASYIRNQEANPQLTSSFWISGRGSADILNAGTEFQINGSRVLNAPGAFNFFAGRSAASVNTGDSNTFVGSFAGNANTSGSTNSFFGTGAGQKNTTGGSNAFFGRGAGNKNTTGGNNAFFGEIAGNENTTGTLNAFFGYFAGGANTTGTNNTLIGAITNVGANNLTFATAVGSGAVVSASNAVVLGRTNDNVGIGTTTPGFKLDVADRVRVKQESNSIGGTNSAGIFFYQNGPATERAFVGMETDNSVGFFGVNGGGWSLAMNTQTGTVKVVNLGSAGSTALCRNASNEISTCSSSLRYKTNIGRFSQGMSFVNKLRPITFDWKDGGMEDVGFGAEDIAKIDPRFVTYNDKGEVEGVKYDRLSVAFVNAFKEQQAQIEKQQTQIEAQQNENSELKKEINALKSVVCSVRPDADICKAQGEIK